MQHLISRGAGGSYSQFFALDTKNAQLFHYNCASDSSLFCLFSFLGFLYVHANVEHL